MGTTQLLVISSFPKKGEIHSKATVGVASYTKQLLAGLQEYYPDKKITVFAEEIAGEDKIYEETGIRVQRVWKRKSFWSLMKLFSKIRKNKATTIVLSFEAFMFGNALLSLFGILIMGIQRILGKKTIILLHQVVDASQNFGFTQQKAFITTIGARVLNFLVIHLFTMVVVFEQQLAKILGSRNVKVVPHLIPEIVILNKPQARRRLEWDTNKKYLLCFGYLAPYKGLKELVDNWPETSDWTLVLAGDINPNHIHSPEVVGYVHDLKNSADKKGIIVTGYVEETEISTYYSAVDAVIVPYPVFFSSSGPLSLAFAYEKPVMMNSALRSYSESEDIKAALNESHLKSDDICYESENQGLKKGLTHILDKEIELVNFSRTMKLKRSLQQIVATFTLAIDEA